MDKSKLVSSLIILLVFCGFLYFASNKDKASNTEEALETKKPRYSQEIRDLPPVHTDEEIFGTKHMSDDYFREQIEEYGDIARRFIYPDLEMIDFVYEFDSNGDGEKEQIVGLCSLWGTGCPHDILIIKGEKIIFEADGLDIEYIGSWNEGFILKWQREYKDPYGYVLTRFKWDGEKFEPIKEYDIRY